MLIHKYFDSLRALSDDISLYPEHESEAYFNGQ